MHSAPYFAAFGLLTILHAYRVIRLRWKHRVSLGDGDIPELRRMIRAFGNHAEYVPLGLVLLLALEFEQADVWFLHLSGMLLLIGRILHAYAISSIEGPNRGRQVGMILTFASFAVMSIGILVYSFLRPV